MADLHLAPGVLPALDELTRAVRAATAVLEELDAERHRLRSGCEHWTGGHRARFDELLAALERRRDDVAAGLATAHLALRRAAEDLGR